MFRTSIRKVRSFLGRKKRIELKKHAISTECGQCTVDFFRKILAQNASNFTSFSLAESWEGSEIIEEDAWYITNNGILDVFCPFRAIANSFNSHAKCTSLLYHLKPSIHLVKKRTNLLIWLKYAIFSYQKTFNLTGEKFTYVVYTDEPFSGESFVTLKHAKTLTSNPEYMLAGFPAQIQWPSNLSKAQSNCRGTNAIFRGINCTKRNIRWYSQSYWKLTKFPSTLSPKDYANHVFFHGR